MLPNGIWPKTLPLIVLYNDRLYGRTSACPRYLIMATTIAFRRKNFIRCEFMIISEVNRVTVYGFSELF